MQDRTMTRDEFCARFKARMLARVGPTDAEGADVAEYADMTAPSYWDDPDQREDGPEACADADLDCWDPA
jgi:hypothetical protein